MVFDCYGCKNKKTPVINSLIGDLSTRAMKYLKYLF